MPPQRTRTALRGQEGSPPQGAKNVAHGHAHIKSTFNNTIVSITDPLGNVISWASAGHVGFKGSRKSTPFAAQMAAENAARKAQEHGMRRSTSSSRARARAARPRSVRCRPPASRSAPSLTSPRSRTTAAARPSGASASRRIQTWLVTPDPRRVSRVASTSTWSVATGRSRRRPYPPGQHGRARIKQSEYLHADAGEAEGQVQLRRPGEAVPPLLRGGSPSPRQDR